jgi:Protein of unknown function (DUF998)
VALKLALVCGILSPLLYIAMIVFVPTLYPGYSSASQTVSELSAIGAPTRRLWVWLGTAYTLLMTAFGWGVWRSAGHNRALHAVGALTLVHGLIGLYWPPMHVRGAELTLTDTMHIVWSMATVLLMTLAMGFGAIAFGSRFRLYSIATLGILVVSGALAGMDGPRIAANLPTPWVGIWQRISIVALMLWLIVLATRLLRAPTDRPA